MSAFRCVECGAVLEAPERGVAIGCDCGASFEAGFGGWDFRPSNDDDNRDVQAEIYDGMVGKLTNFSQPHNLMLRYQGRLVERFIKREDRVLEIGGHRSGLLPFLEERREARCSGVDISATWVAEQNRLARIRGTETQWVLADAANLPFPDDHFDAICSFDVFEHLSDAGAAITEVARVLRPGGLFICHMPVRDIEGSMDGLQRRFRGDKWRAAQANVGHFHDQMASSGELVGMFEGEGMEIVLNEPYNVWLQPLHDYKLLSRLGKLRHGGKSVHAREETPTSDAAPAEGGGGGIQALYSKYVIPVAAVLTMPDRIGVALGVGGSRTFVVRAGS